MTNEEIRETLADNYPDAITADGFDDAIVGILSGCGRPDVVCYDYAKCVEVLMKRDHMSEEEAQEYMDFNVVGAYVGKASPLFLHNWRSE